MEDQRTRQRLVLEPPPRLERVAGVRVQAMTSIDELIDPVSLFYVLSIAAGAVAGMVVATLRLT